jgi:hypothetical protein
MDWEQWNNAARRRGQRAHTRRTDGKAHPHLAIGIDGTPQSRDAAEGSQCMMRWSGTSHISKTVYERLPNVYYIIKSIYDQQTPVGQLNKKWWPYITKRPQGQFARTFHQSEQVGTMEYSGSFYRTNPEAS